MSVDPKETEAWVERTLDELDHTVYTSENGEVYDGFVNLRNHLPEIPMPMTMGGDLLIGLDGAKAMAMRPIGVHQSGLVVCDLTELARQSARPVYYLLFGSMYFAEGDIEKCGPELVSKVTTALVRQGQPTAMVTPEGLRVSYSPNTFCRDTRLAYTRAYSGEDFQDAELLIKTTTGDMVGKMISVQPTPNTPLTLFVPFHPLKFTLPVSGISQRVGDASRPLLSYV